MITPIELHNRQHKTGRGYNKKEMDIFLDEVISNYEILYKENAELKDKITQLSDGIQYYKAMETTLQKALVLAEKTSKDTIESANAKAAVIEKEANLKADTIVNNALSKSEEIKKECISLLQQYKQFKAQFKQIAQKQIELLDGNFYEIYSKDLIDAINEVSFGENENVAVKQDKTEEISAKDNINEDNNVIANGEKEDISQNNDIDEENTLQKAAIVDDISETIDESILKSDTKEFTPIEIEVIGKNKAESSSDETANETVIEAEVPEDINDNEEDNEEDNDDDPFNKIIRELKEDLANEIANSSSNSSFEFIDNE